MGLGPVQQHALDSLRRHGYWFAGCGWLWDTHSRTTKLMNSLVKSGLAELRMHPKYNCMAYFPRPIPSLPSEHQRDLTIRILKQCMAYSKEMGDQLSKSDAKFLAPLDEAAEEYADYIEEVNALNDPTL